MSFDWLQFLDSNRVNYNIKGREALVHCPFCNDADPDKLRMSISLVGNGWKCWSNKEHVGRAAARLVRALTGCSWEEAIAVAGERKHLPTSFTDTIRNMLEPADIKPAKTQPLKLPDEFKRIDRRKPTAWPFISYLRDDRLFTRDEIDRLTDDYGVRYCTRGSFAGRIVFPVYRERRLMTWTARTIRSSGLRYKTLSTDQEKAAAVGYKPAAGSISEQLLFYDQALTSRATTLIAVEGPFDALKLNIIGEGVVAAVALFRNEISLAQQDLLRGLARRFDRRCILLDVGSYGKAQAICSDLRPLGFEPLMVPMGTKDPGELTRRNLLKIL